MAGRGTAVAKSGLVQVIRLCWTKAARGGEAARVRSAVPTAFEVPATELASAEGFLCVDVSHWVERNGFGEPLTSHRCRVSLTDGFGFGCVTVSDVLDGLLVRYEYDPTNGGAPNRRVYTPEVHRESHSHSVLARGGEWARVCYNGRFSDIDNGTWWYQQVTVNVAWFSGEPDGRVFLDSQPMHEWRGLADLW